MPAAAGIPERMDEFFSPCRTSCSPPASEFRTPASSAGPYGRKIHPKAVRTAAHRKQESREQKGRKGERKRGAGNREQETESKRQEARSKRPNSPPPREKGPGKRRWAYGSTSKGPEAKIEASGPFSVFCFRSIAPAARGLLAFGRPDPPAPASPSCRTPPIRGT